MENESPDEKFIKLAVRTIGAEAISLPFALNNVIEVNIVLPIPQFDLFYNAFTDRAVFVLTVIDIQTIFEGLIMEIHREDAHPAGYCGCRMRISSIYRVIFDNSINEQGVISQLEYEAVKLGQGQAEAKPREADQNGIESDSNSSS